MALAKTFWSVAVKQNAQALVYASDSLRMNGFIVRSTVKQDGVALHFGSKS